MSDDWGNKLFDDLKRREDAERPSDAPCSISDTDRLEVLIGVLDNEGRDGQWRVSLEYNNYQDVAYVRNADGNIIAECGDLDKSPKDLFRSAIDSLIGN